MVDAKVIEVVHHFRNLVEKGGIRIHTLVLFGSAGAGTMTRGSDIDIAIVSDDFSGKDLFDRALLTKDAELSTVKRFKIPLDVITLTTEEYGDERSLLSRTIRKGIHM